MTWKSCSTSPSLFFTVCYHLRDWLLRDIPSVQSDLDQLFAKSKPLRLSADIANIAKHFDLNIKRIENAAGEIDESFVSVLPEDDLRVFNTEHPRPDYAIDCEGALGLLNKVK